MGSLTFWSRSRRLLAGRREWGVGRGRIVDWGMDDRLLGLFVLVDLNVCCVVGWV